MSYLKTLMLFCLLFATGRAAAQKADAILGVWKAEEKVLTIRIYRQDSEYRGKVVTYKDRHHPEKDPEARRDVHNPDPDLRQRKIIGMDVLTGLHYNEADDAWEGGTLYNPGKGNTYSANVSINSSGKLEVRAFKGVTLLGKTMVFRR